MTNEMIKIDLPIYELDLPVQQTKISFRYWSIKELKILLMALESESERDMFLAVKQICNNCLLSDSNIMNWPLADVEYFYLKIRCQSKGSVIKNGFSVMTSMGDQEKIHLINLHDCYVSTESAKEILLDDNSKIKCNPVKFGRYLDSLAFKDDLLPNDVILGFSYFIRGDKSISLQDLPIEKVMEVIESLSADDLSNLTTYDPPRVEYKIPVGRMFDSGDSSLILRGLQDFFALASKKIHT